MINKIHHDYLKLLHIFRQVQYDFALGQSELVEDIAFGINFFNSF